MTEARFQHWSCTHISIILMTFIASFFLAYAVRRIKQDPVKSGIGIALATLLILNQIAYQIHRIYLGNWELRYDLPMELCNWAVFVTAAALVTKNIFLSELSYFWVMAGSVNALITPNINVGFPHPYFFIFFIEHSGVIIACSLAVFGFKLYPRKGAIFRAAAMTEIYFIIAMLVNHAVDGNYAFLVRKPDSGSLMDYMGEWPIYLLSLQVVGFLFFIAVYLPFYIKNNERLKIFIKGGFNKILRK